MQVFLYMRVTTDWQNMTMSNFVKQCPFLNDNLLHSVRAWNSEFSMSYFEFRHQLKQIAITNLSELKGIAGVVNATCWERVPSDAYLLPVDDDDWFHPDLVQRVAAVHNGSPCYQWNHSTVGFFASDSLDQSRSIREWGVCFGTNSYMLHRSAANSMRLEHHWANHGCPYVRLNERLNLANKTMASVLNVQENISLIDRYFLEIIEPVIPNYFLWAKKYIDATTQLYHSMRPFKFFR